MPALSALIESMMNLIFRTYASHIIRLCNACEWRVWRKTDFRGEEIIIRK